MGNDSKNITNSVRKIFKEYISTEIPQKISNVLWSLFRGVEAVLEHLEWKIDLMIRERNMMTASHQSSLRALAAENGFEPTLMIPSKGSLNLSVNYKLYNTNGYPLFLPPYSTFKCIDNGLTYYYDSDKALTLDNNSYTISVVQGEINEDVFEGNSESIQRIYLTKHNITDKSIRVTVNGDEFTEVKSFFDNEGLNNNKQFLIKYSRDIQKPFIIYIKGTKANDKIIVTYRTCYGELGNLSSKTTFKTESIINQYGETITVTDTDIQITNVYGFNFGSEGNDENSFRSAIGFNHGHHILYDNISYKNFINKFSTLLLQSITVDENHRQINDIYIGKKVILKNGNTISTAITTLYKQTIDNMSYVMSDEEKNELNNLISEYEYCLSSHRIHDLQTIRYAIQIMYKTYYDLNNHQFAVQNLLYDAFAKFFYDKYNRVNITELLSTYMSENDVKFEFIVFRESDDPTEHVCSDNLDISHDDKLPIISGGFTIKTTDNIIYTISVDNPIMSVIVQ